jgi:undecaprenyl diphosphate synthase
MRLSDFLMFESAYAELYFSEALWPDFDEQELDRALEAYGRRARRFGKVASMPDRVPPAAEARG